MSTNRQTDSKPTARVSPRSNHLVDLRQWIVLGVKLGIPVRKIKKWLPERHPIWPMNTPPDATGVFSSRKLERATYDSVAFRFIAANDHPDHDTIVKPILNRQRA